jgi:hypothetical protein
MLADELVSIFVRSVQKDEYQICKGEEGMGKYYKLKELLSSHFEKSIPPKRESSAEFIFKFSHT